jgi:hypothetical protein
MAENTTGSGSGSGSGISRNEMRELRKQVIHSILQNAIEAFKMGNYKDARDYARTASDAIHLEFVQQPD